MSERDLERLPADLPVPQDDGAAEGLAGRMLPSLALASTGGGPVDLAEAAMGTLVLYVYPRTGTPGETVPPGWDEIPGARGCTPENCAFRDHAHDLAALGATVHGLSAQPLEEQQAFAEREAMPYPLLNDADLLLARELGLPTFEFAGRRLYKRLTLIARAGRIDKVFYPVFPPEAHASEVLAWLREQAA
jgi:peroxiredoxin